MTSDPNIPTTLDNAILKVDGRDVRLTNLRKLFWPELGITKAALIQYYLDVGPVLLPHLARRAMVMSSSAASNNRLPSLRMCEMYMP